MNHHPNFKDLTAQVFTRITVKRYAGKDKWGNSKYLCNCACGEKDITMLGCSLNSKRTKSCGCLRRELTAKRLTTHGHAKNGSQSPEYTAWDSMLARCTNPNTKCWSNYGGRGIQVCTLWRNSFEAFLAYIGKRPKGKSLDRINNNGHYVPGNVRWSTTKQQRNNQRKRGTQEPVIPFVDVK